MENYDYKLELAIQNAILNDSAKIKYKDEDETNISENGTDTVHTICESGNNTI